MPDSTRDSRGRFLPGAVNVSPGRPRQNPEIKLKSVFGEVLTREELREIILTHVARAKAGSVNSARLILEYAVGKPRERLAVDVTARGALWAFIQDARAGGPVDGGPVDGATVIDGAPVASAEPE